MFLAGSSESVTGKRFQARLMYHSVHSYRKWKKVDWGEVSRPFHLPLKGHTLAFAYTIYRSPYITLSLTLSLVTRLKATEIKSNFRRYVTHAEGSDQLSIQLTSRCEAGQLLPLIFSFFTKYTHFGESRHPQYEFFKATHKIQCIKWSLWDHS